MNTAEKIATLEKLLGQIQTRKRTATDTPIESDATPQLIPVDEPIELTQKVAKSTEEEPPQLIVVEDDAPQLIPVDEPLLSLDEPAVLIPVEEPAAPKAPTAPKAVAPTAPKAVAPAAPKVARKPVAKVEPISVAKPKPKPAVEPKEEITRLEIEADSMAAPSTPIAKVVGTPPSQAPLTFIELIERSLALRPK